MDSTSIPGFPKSFKMKFQKFLFCKFSQVFWVDCLDAAVVSLCIFVTFFSLLNKNRGMLESEKGQDIYFYLSLTWLGQSASEYVGSWSEG